MKEWLTLIIVLLILAILFDGWRRMRNARSGNIRVSSAIKKQYKYNDSYDDNSDNSLEKNSLEKESYTSELPNGGARVVGRRDPKAPVPSIERKAMAKSYLEKQERSYQQERSQEEKGQEEKHQEEKSAVNEYAPAREQSMRAQARKPEQTRLNLEESVPILMESVQDAQEFQSVKRLEPSISSDDIDEPLDEDSSYGNQNYRDQNFESNDHTDDDDSDHHYETDDLDEDYQESTDSTTENPEEHVVQQPQREPEEVLIINVMAFKGEMFGGSDLLDALLKNGLRFGSMDIFHRHSDAKGEGALLFSMANMVKPGTFDLDTMDQFETPGVSFFMTLPLPNNADSMQSFELMLETARSIAETLDGELKDEQRSVMTRQTLDHCRERVRDFERKRLFQRNR